MHDQVPLINQFTGTLPNGVTISVYLASPATLRICFSTTAEPRNLPSYSVVKKLFPHSGCWMAPLDKEECRDDEQEYYALKRSFRMSTMGTPRLFSHDLPDDPGGDGSDTPDDPFPHSEEEAASKTTLVIEYRRDPFSLLIKDNAGNVRFKTSGLGIERHGEKMTLRRRLDQGEAIYGLGEHGDTFNRNPGRYRIWNKDEANHHAFRQYYCTIPFGISCPPNGLPPHGFLVDNPGEVGVDVGMADPGEVSITTHTGDLDLWLLFEDSPADVIGEYTNLTGRMRRPPLWSLGYQQCRWSYMTSKRVREVASEMRRRRIPCDVVYMDIDYMEKFRVFTWNTRDFNDYELLLKELIADNFSPLCIIDPGVAIASGYEPYEYGIAHEGFFLKRRSDDKPVIEEVWPGPVHHPDFTNPEVRAKWGEWQFETLLSKGIAGVWNDMNEPAIFQAGGGTREYPGDTIHHDDGFYRTHREIHNIYGQTMAQASCEGQIMHRPDSRPFTLTRSGWAGIQRYSAVWTGDNRSAWTTMPLDIALNLNMGMSGVPFVGCDIGGFQNDATPELFARWMEWGVFQPFCRGHSAMGTRDQEPWAFGPETEQVCRRMLELRYQLIPYIYTQFVDASETGLPVNRPLVLEYPNDATVVSIGDQFLLGPDLLIAPVLETGKSHRSLYLPPGEWVHFWSRNRHQGGKWILVPAPYGQPPLFVRAGAVLPMHPVRQHLKGHAPETTILDIYPASTLNGRMVEDDGETLAYERGQECRVLFSGIENETHLKLIIGSPQGPYRSPRKFWQIRLHRGDRPIRQIRCGAGEVPFQKEGQATTFTIPDSGAAQEIVVEYGP